MDIPNFSKKIEEALGCNTKNYRAEYTITLSGSRWYWLVLLAELGFYAKVKYKSMWGREKVRESEKAISLASWREELVK